MKYICILVLLALLSFSFAAEKAIMKKITLVVQDGEKTILDLAKDTELTQAITENTKMRLRFEFGNEINPHQAFVRLTNKEMDFSKFLLPKISKGTYIVDFNFKKENSFVSGAYDMELVIGDISFESEIKHLINLDMEFPEEDTKKDFPLYSVPLLHESDTTRESLPEIHHQFKTYKERPQLWISYLFSFLAVIPFIVFLFFLRKLTNFDYFPVKTIPLLWTVSFLTCFASILVLFVLFWMYLPTVDCLCWLVVLGIPTFITGNRSLRAIAVEKKKDEDRN
eukprot:TRINITY_DN776279_c0_g1_i1.p1 TRINITY_DN776279_c0_g1~~TRINITY_DN776279_c0_g1_i1.p1  ORF type:complete len:281 (-),score=63.20 TRINITY_DN776279_c0_g1_i1:118-960(-)